MKRGDQFVRLFSFYSRVVGATSLFESKMNAKK